jgi:hypothetical protein
MTNFRDFDVEAYRREHPELFAGVPISRKETMKISEQTILTAEKERRHKRGKTRHQQAIDLIVDYAHLKGWKCAYFRPARVMRGGKEIYETPVGADGRGFPDMVLSRLRDPEEYERPYLGNYKITLLLFWEVKVGKDRVRPEQKEWLDLLEGRVVNPFDEQDWQYIVEALG